MNNERNIPKTYEPQKFEAEVYKKWEHDKNFHTEASALGRPYCIVIPPPNVTGQLHMGHALDETLQDILIRYHRMKGDNTLWIPGTDHAGIATQAKVEENLRSEGTNRYELGREKFLERVWQWKEKYGNRITYQLRALGSSCDWERERFTMDENYSAAIRKVFVALYNEGLIYQGTRIINWCPKCNTALSDIEVEHESEQGTLWYIQYKIKDSDEFIEIATTRPETMLGDTGVAVHPEDERYKKFIGKTLILPIVNREIPLFADTYVDKDFGTGAVKVTPAHDSNDFEMGIRHKLAQIKVINNDGTMSQGLGKYSGLDRYDCRKILLKDLESGGYLVSTKKHEHSVGHCSRCHATVEPLVSKQWFVKMETLAQPAIAAIKNNELRFVPERFSKIYINWLKDIRDWCISRQLWWGHRIPAWHCEHCGKITVAEKNIEVCEHCGSKKIKQDEDVLDTWFSSSLWPFATLGYPLETAELKKFYPTSVLVTGYDIIFFWVARMVMMGLKFQNAVPFRNIFIHGLVRDESGRKMSKSLNNGVDPVKIIEKYGADSLRFMLVTGNTPGNDLKFFYSRIESARNFANKIWNASRFLLMNIEHFDKNFEPSIENVELADLWIISRLDITINKVTKNIDCFELGEAARLIYEFIWSDFCDYYIELAKSKLYGNDKKAKLTALYFLNFVLEKVLRLLHPFMPFLTEVIYQKLPETGGSIMLADWVESKELNKFLNSEFNNELKDFSSIILGIVRIIRNLKAENDIESRSKVKIVLRVSDSTRRKFLQNNLKYITELAAAEQIFFADKKPEHALSGVIKEIEIFLPIKGLIDAQKEIARLSKELDKQRKFSIALSNKLSDKNFLSKAPSEIVQTERYKFKESTEKIFALEQRIKQLETL